MSRPHRILMTADTVGGVWTYCVELIAALKGRNLEILLATLGPAPNASQRGQLTEFDHVQLASREFKLEWMEEPWIEVDAAGAWLLELAEGFQPDVIHLNGYVHAALPWKVPVLVVAHSCVLSWWSAVKAESAPARWAEYRRRVSLGLSTAQRIVAPTRSMLMMLQEHYTFATSVRVIPNSRNPQLFPPGEKRPEIFSAGRIWDEAKNTQLLERIAPSLDWPVYLAGQKTKAHRSPISQPSTLPATSPIFLGELSATMLARELASASIYAAPALYEPFGLGILEAALAGCALVLSDIASLRENWEGAALFVTPDDEPAWRAALNALAQDSSQLHSLATAARKRALEFNSAQTVEAYLQTWRELATLSSSIESVLK